jgi:hypothetical protein
MSEKITKGHLHQKQFLEALKRVPLHKALTIKDLKDLDDAELASVIELQTPVKSEDEAA